MGLSLRTSSHRHLLRVDPIGMIMPTSKETSQLKHGEDLYQHRQRIHGPLARVKNRTDLRVDITNAHRPWAWYAEEKHGTITTKLQWMELCLFLDWLHYVPWAFVGLLI